MPVKPSRRALRQQGKVQAGDEIHTAAQRVEQLLEERDAPERKHHELLGNLQRGFSG